MPVPKRKHSKGRTKRKRNSHYFKTVTNSVKCKNCGADKLPHTECKECGK